eukprot:Skav216037  [mRNA]  locus=scaffold2403:65884:69072:- [translate_table: standard]
MSSSVPPQRLPGGTAADVDLGISVSSSVKPTQLWLIKDKRVWICVCVVCLLLLWFLEASCTWLILLPC